MENQFKNTIADSLIKRILRMVEIKNTCLF